MKKTFLILLIGIFILTFSSAAEFDNKAIYFENDDKVVVMNNFNIPFLGNEIGTSTLLTPKENYVIRGYNEVMRISMLGYEDYSDALKDFEFTDMNTGETTTRQIDLKYVIKEDIKIIDYTYNNCKKEYNIIKCDRVISGSHIEQIEKFIDIPNMVNIKEGEDVIISFWTEVLPGDSIDLIPTIYGDTIDKWAVWTESLNSELVGYYNLDNNSFNDSNGDNDLFNTNTINTSGKILDGRDFAATSNINGSGFTSTIENYTIQMWLRPDTNTGDQVIFDDYRGVPGDRIFLFITSSGLGHPTTIGLFNGTDSADWGQAAIIDGYNMYHFVFDNSAGKVFLYINATKEVVELPYGGLDMFDNITIGSDINNNSNYNGKMDEIAIWHRALSQSEITQLFNSGAGLPYVQVGPIINLNSPADNFNTVNNLIAFNATVNVTNSEIINVSLLINNIVNITNTSGNIDNYLFDLTLPVGSYNWSIRSVDNESITANSGNRSLTISKILVINETFNNITIEGATEQFTINFIKGSNFQVSTVDLYYNGTANSFPYSVSDNNVSSQNSITIPIVSSDINVSFYWNITLDDGTHFITSSNNQTILSINVDDCSVFTNLIYNFTQYDEENQTLLSNNNTIELQINLYDTRKTSSLANFSNQFTNINPVQFCAETPILPTVNYSSYVIVKYFVNNSDVNKAYSVEYYNILNQTIGNMTIPKNIALYNLKVPDTTKFRLTFRDGEYVLAPNILVQVHRQYIQDNDFKIVEIPITDSNGQTILNLVKDNIVYNFIMTNEAGEVVGTFNSIKAFCADFSIGDCTINLAPDSLSEEAYDYNEEFDISISAPSYDNSTQKISVNFITGDLSPNTVRMQVIRNNQFGNRSVCSDSLLAASGVLSCDVSAVTDTDQFLFISTFVEDDLAKQDPINLNSDILNFGTLNGAFYAFLMILFIITMFMEDKKVLVVSLGLGWVVIISLGLVNGKLIGFTSAGIWILISIAIFLWKLNDEESP